MWIICDPVQVVIDKASNQENLSRGYQIAGVPKGDDELLTAALYVKYEVTEKLDMRVGDKYDGNVVTPNTNLRLNSELSGIKRALIWNEIEKDKAQELGFVDIQTELQDEIDSLNVRKQQVEVAIT